MCLRPQSKGSFQRGYHHTLRLTDGNFLRRFFPQRCCYASRGCIVCQLLSCNTDSKPLITPFHRAAVCAALFLLSACMQCENHPAATANPSFCLLPYCACCVAVKVCQAAVSPLRKWCCDGVVSMQHNGSSIAFLCV